METLNSLAILAYFTHPEKVSDHMICKSWFENSEFELKMDTNTNLVDI